ncbi:hypothetical protein BHE74_00050021 [Ensete ventricosum]|nr:hypothetical protein BHE74_00050021 [Ensete ventricosum]RZS21822.1 hypothetical protein BHM03_00054512 [Ensete ventricosum]
MLCCGGAEEENYGPPASQYAAPPNRNAPGHDRDPRGPMAARNGAPPKVLPIEIPAISMSELNRLTNNFSDKALVGEGSYGRVFRATLNTGEPAAIKKLDPSASNEPDTDFAAQPRVYIRLEFLELSDIMLQSKYAMTGQLTQKSDVYSFGVILLELLTGRKPVDHTMPKGQQSLVTWATPRLSEDKVKQCVDPKLNDEYPPKAVAKLAAVAALCVQYESDFRPNMTIVVKALQPLLNAKPVQEQA